MRRLPSRRSFNSPASRRTARCCEIAGRLTSKHEAMSPAERSSKRTRRMISRRRGSAMARSTASTASSGPPAQKGDERVGRRGPSGGGQRWAETLARPPPVVGDDLLGDLQGGRGERRVEGGIDVQRAGKVPAVYEGVEEIDAGGDLCRQLEAAPQDACTLEGAGLPPGGQRRRGGLLELRARIGPHEVGLRLRLGSRRRP